MRAEPPPRSQHPNKFNDHKSCESGDTNCSNCHEIWQYLLIQDHMTIWKGVPQGEPPTCQVC